MTADRDAIRKQLIGHEGFELFPYTDTVGKLTIGCGRNLSDKGLSKAEVLDLLDHDIDECVADLAGYPWFRELDAVRQRVLIDMRFNLGPSRFRSFRRMLQALAAKDYIKAAASMRDSLWAKQVKGRADRLIQMMVTGQA